MATQLLCKVGLMALQGTMLLGWLMPQASVWARNPGRANHSTSSSWLHNGDWVEAEYCDLSQTNQDASLEFFKLKQEMELLSLLREVWKYKPSTSGASWGTSQSGRLTMEGSDNKAGKGPVSQDQLVPVVSRPSWEGRKSPPTLF